MNDDNNGGDPLDRSLGIEPFKQQIMEIVGIAKNDSAEQDFTFARSNIRKSIDIGTDALEQLANLAEQSQSPRTYEVLSTLMQSIVAASEKLLDVQKTIREIDDADKPRDDDAKKTINNNLFVGSTAELQKILKDMRDIPDE